MDPGTTQLRFFQHIKSILPEHISFVDEIAALLNISNDSAYRRIRGEKAISLEEMQTLAGHFKISIDQFLHLQTDSYIFTGKIPGPGESAFEDWLQNVLRQLTVISGFSHKHMYYLAKDVPIMDQFMVPELLAFKSFLWRRSILQYPGLKGMKFSLQDADPVHMEMAKKIEAVYLTIPTTEIWNVESINSTIRQIEFYRDADMFLDLQDISKVYLALLKLVDHLELQAESGLKFRIGESPRQGAANFTLFWNDLVTADNTLLIELDQKKVAFLNHSVLHFISTTDSNFTGFIYQNMQNLIKRSTQLSIVGEKDRYRFFNSLRDKIKIAGRL